MAIYRSPDEQIRDLHAGAYRVIKTLLPESREQSLALTKADELILWLREGLRKIEEVEQ